MGDFSDNLHRIYESADVERHFQEVLDEFPRHKVNGAEQIQFSEISAYLIRPLGEPQNQLTHLLMPESLILVPDSDVTLKGHGAMAFPRITLHVDVNTDDLYLSIATHQMSEDNHVQRVAVMLPYGDVHFVHGIWNAFDTSGQEELRHYGYRPNMDPREWGKAINEDPRAETPSVWPSKSAKVKSLRELPISINRRGCVGTNGTYNDYPDRAIEMLCNNCFYYDEETTYESESDRLFDVGDVHTHSLINKPSPIQEAVEAIVGRDTVRRNPSVPDVRSARASEATYRTHCDFHFDRRIKCMKTFLGVLAVDASGQIDGAKYLDLYSVDEKKLTYLNDRAWETMYESDRPDPQIIAEFYKYIASETTDDFGSEHSAPYVGTQRL